jgi:hypothetical protein
MAEDNSGATPTSESGWLARPRWKAVCMSCGAASPENAGRSDAMHWKHEHQATEGCQDVILQLHGRMLGGGSAWFFG